MENQLNIKASEEEPHISLDKVSGTFIIEGRSMPEDAYAFYTPVISWLESYVENPNAKTNAIFNLDYFNSGSVKQVFTILCILEEILETGKEINIEWTFEKGDELMQSKGIEFNKFLDVDLEVSER